MSCPCNIKKFLWWEYEGDHDYYYPTCNIQQGLFGASNTWIYTRHCRKCQNYEWVNASHVDMVRMKLITPDGEVIEQEDE